MSEPENFLGRWSRRKREAEQDKAFASDEQDPSARPRESGDLEPRNGTEPHKEAAESAALDPRHKASEATPSLTAMRGDERKPDAGETKPAANDASKGEPAFDLASLPSIDSITAATDVRAFLQHGVPAELTRAALRRAWSADPAIRDFIGIAENQYDFATGSDLPGFGDLDLSADEIRRIVADVFGGLKAPDAAEHAGGEGAPETPAESASSTAAIAAAPPVETATDAAVGAHEAASIDPGKVSPDAIVHRNKDEGAMQQDDRDPEPATRFARRSHGRALPQ